MDYLNRLRSTVTSVAAQVSNALPGNPVTRDYEIVTQIASAGPGLCWKIYEGRKHSTKQAVAVWLFEKKDLERWPKHEREIFADTLRKGVSQLTRLRHPRILVIEHPLEESRDSFAFCTEPVFASLANCLGRRDNLAPTIPFHLVDFEFLDVEIRHGLFQLAEALSFLHIDAHMLHRNICPESVIVNGQGSWKLAGFDFAIQATTSAASGQMQYEMLEWNERTISLIQPSLDYLAPEYVVGGRCDTFADIYSLGILAIAIFNHCRPPFDHRSSLETFRKNAEKLKALPNSVLVNVPAQLRDDVKMCLNFTPDLRPDATQFSKIAYFDDALMKTINYFDSLCQMDNAQKMHFFKALPQILANFPKRPLLQKILPYLSAEFTTADLIPFILPSIFLIAEQSDNTEFASVILPQLIPVFPMEKPYQIVLMLLQKMELLLQKTPEEDIKRHLLPLIYNALSNEVTKIQELCLSIIPNVGKLVDRDSMKVNLLPRLLRLAVDGGVLSVRVQALICLGKLLPTLEPWMVSDQILPALPKINSKEPGVLMAILGIYKLAYENARFGIAREQCAKSVLPFLIATSVENTLNLQQFEQFFAMIHAMLAKVEREQRQRLEQLSASQEEQRNVLDFNEVIANVEAKKTIVNKHFDGLAELENGINGGSSQNSTAVSATKKNIGVLSLEEKKRLAAEQEQNVRMRTQPALLQPSSGHGTPSGTLSKPTAVQTGQRSVSPLDSLLDKSLSGLSGPVLPASGSSSARSSGIIAGASIDLSEFLPPSMMNSKGQQGLPMAKVPVPVPAQMSPGIGIGAAGDGSSLTQQFGGPLNFNSGPAIMGLPGPPPSTNPVHRNTPSFGRGTSAMPVAMPIARAPPSSLSDSSTKPDLSAFDSLLPFPKSSFNTTSSGGRSTSDADGVMSSLLMMSNNNSNNGNNNNNNMGKSFPARKPKKVVSGKDPFANLFD